MDLPFLTLNSFDGRRLKGFSHCGAMGGGHAGSWEEGITGDAFQLVFERVASILKDKDESLERIDQLQYHDKKGFDNRIFRVHGSKQVYFLKILGDRQGNRRELFVWKLMGYNDMGKRSAKQWFPGLPPEVWALEQLNSVLMPFYPGQLSAIPGGAYEFPLVLALALYLDQTLKGMHQVGITYMDLCPENILYLERHKDAPLTFFLADMGSVKLLPEGNGEAEIRETLASLITPQRMTRNETAPPLNLFQQEDNIVEQDPGYDYHTLARTLLILLGLGNVTEINPGLGASFSEHLNLELPLEPKKDEVARFLELLKAPLLGKNLETEKLYELYRDFYITRAQFVATHLDDAKLNQHWKETLLHRINRYKMILKGEDKQRFAQEISEQLGQQTTEQLGMQIKMLMEVPHQLKNGQLEQAAEHLNQLKDSSLLQISKTARYSHGYHSKLLRCLSRRQKKQVNLLASDAANTVNLDQIPEKKTIESLRRGMGQNLGILTRPLIQQLEVTS